MFTFKVTEFCVHGIEFGRLFIDLTTPFAFDVLVRLVLGGQSVVLCLEHLEKVIKPRRRRRGGHNVVILLIVIVLFLKCVVVVAAVVVDCCTTIVKCAGVIVYCYVILYTAFSLFFFFLVSFWMTVGVSRSARACWRRGARRGAKETTRRRGRSDGR